MGHLLGCRAHAQKKVHSFLPKQEARWNMDRSIRAVGGSSFLYVPGALGQQPLNLSSGSIGKFVLWFYPEEEFCPSRVGKT